MTELPVMLVTGTSRGIGDHLARHFCAHGYQVVGCSRSPHDFHHPRYRHVFADVAAEDQVVDLFRAIRRDYGRLDVAVNNAVHAEGLARVDMTSASSLSQALATNVIGPFVVAREATRLMMRRKFGRIVNIGSMATAHPIEGGAAYTAAKAAIDAMTEIHAREVAGLGITCNVVAPAGVRTPLLDTLPEERVRSNLAHNAIPEPGSADDVAALVEWLASPAGGGVTGQVIYLGGA